MADHFPDSYELSQQGGRHSRLLSADESMNERVSQDTDRTGRSSSAHSGAPTTSTTPHTYHALPTGSVQPLSTQQLVASHEESSDKKRSWEDFSTSYAFAILSFFSILIVIVNFLQLGLLHRLSDSQWINGPPGVILAAGTIVLAFYMFHGKNWKTAQSNWSKAKRRQRAAWIGVILSILLPILICEFAYLNAWALPQYREKIWTSSLDFRYNLRAPSLLIISFDEYVGMDQAVFGGPGYCEYNDVGDCDNNMSWNTKYKDFRYHLFNASSPHLSLAPGEYVEINMNVTWGDASGIDPYLYYALVDSELDWESTLPYVEIGGCSLFDGHYVPVIGTNYITVQPYEMNDVVKALQYSNTSEACGNYTKYSYYRSSINHFTFLDRSSCNYDSPSFTGPCLSSTRISFATNLVTTQQSKHGMDWMQMLTDEGSIAGGIMFFTWFLGIYVL